MKKTREMKAFPAMKSAENLTSKRRKARNEERKKAKNSFLDLLGHFSHGRALDSDTVVTTHRILMVLGTVRKATILNFSVNLSTAQRGLTGGRATLVQWDLTEIHHTASHGV